MQGGSPSQTHHTLPKLSLALAASPPHRLATQELGHAADWRSELTAHLQSALPLFHSGALVGVFLGDEMMCSKIPFSNYSAVASAVRQWLSNASLEEVLIYSNECSTPLVRDGEVWSMPKKLPVELDLFS